MGEGATPIGEMLMIGRGGQDGSPEADAAQTSTFPDVKNTATALALSLTLCAVGFGLAGLTGWRGSGILIVTAITVTLATILPGPMEKMRGADVVGSFLMQIFFAVIGASANVVVAQIAHRNNYRLTFMDFTRMGMPVMLLSVSLATVYVYLRYFLVRG